MAATVTNFPPLANPHKNRFQQIDIAQCRESCLQHSDRDVKQTRLTAKPNHGVVRAIFGLIVGILGTIALLLIR